MIICTTQTQPATARASAVAVLVIDGVWIWWEAFDLKRYQTFSVMYMG